MKAYSSLHRSNSSESLDDRCPLTKNDKSQKQKGVRIKEKKNKEKSGSATAVGVGAIATYPLAVSAAVSAAVASEVTTTSVVVAGACAGLTVCFMAVPIMLSGGLIGYTVHKIYKIHQKKNSKTSQSNIEYKKFST